MLPYSGEVLIFVKFVRHHKLANFNSEITVLLSEANL